MYIYIKLYKHICMSWSKGEVRSLFGMIDRSRGLTKSLGQFSKHLCVSIFYSCLCNQF